MLSQEFFSAGHMRSFAPSHQTPESVELESDRRNVHNPRPDFDNDDRRPRLKDTERMYGSSTYGSVRRQLPPLTSLTYIDGGPDGRPWNARSLRSLSLNCSFSAPPRRHSGR